MNKIKRMFLALGFNLAAFAGSYQVSIDPHYSPYMGSDLLLSMHETMMITEDFAASKEQIPKRGLKHSFYRFLDLTLFWEPFNHAERVIQHEVFGHGYRIRSLRHADLIKYSFKLPPPYGDGTGATHFYIKNELKFGEFQAITVAGLEAESIMSKQIKRKIFKKGKISPKLSSLYIMTRYSALMYALVPFPEVSSFQEGLFSGHDIQGFLYGLDAIYPSKTLTHSKVLKKLTLSFFDPLTFYHYGAFWYYLFTGKDMGAPMIKLAKEFYYLPNLTTELAPYGVETYLENYFLFKDSLYYFYLKRGHFQGDEYYGMGLDAEKLWSYGPWSIGARIDLWYQNDFLYNWNMEEAIELNMPPKEGFDVYLTKIPGGSFAIASKYQILNSKSSLFADLGLKSKGYLPGYALKATPTWRVGMSAEF